MKKQDFKIRTKIIEETFNDKRKIKCLTPEDDRKVDENTYPGGDIFTTENGELIDLEFQMEDFTAEELVKYVELAEELYERHQKQVAIYIICPDTVDVLVKECEIKSEADFVIKLARIQENPAEIILKILKDKLEKGIFDLDDLEALLMLPVMCKKEDQHYYRIESLKMINEILE